MKQTASMAPSWLVDAVKLLGDGGEPPRMTGGVSFFRVGRNRVWRISSSTSPQTIYYAKLWSNKTVFARELLGLEVMARLGRRHPWIGHAELVHADEERGVLVTSHVQGVTLQRQLQKMLRRGVPSRGAAVRDQQTLSALERTLRFAQCLHELDAPDDPALARHGTAAVKQRIVRMAKRFLGAGQESRGVLQEIAAGELPDAMPHRCRTSLVFGDLSPGNIFFHDGRIIPIDFEDFGIGPACRDFAYLAYMLEHFGRQWKYRTAEPLVEQVKRMNHCGHASLLHRIEFLVGHLVAVHDRRRRKLDVRRFGDRGETRWIHRELRIAWESIRRGPPRGDGLPAHGGVPRGRIAGTPCVDGHVYPVGRVESSAVRAQDLEHC